MVIDLGVSNIPMPVFMTIHLAATGIAVWLAIRSNERGMGTSFTTAFALYALAEVVYMGYHLKITTFLLSHTISEVMVLVAFLLAAFGVTQTSSRREQDARARAKDARARA